MPIGVRRQQRFQCGGCGRASTLKITVDPEEAKSALLPPPGWFDVSLSGQDPTFGAVATVSVFVCSDTCANAVAQGQGTAVPMLTNFKAFLAGQGVSQAVTEVTDPNESDEEEEEEPQYADEPPTRN